jgi:hypothetical protein
MAAGAERGYYDDVGATGDGFVVFAAAMLGLAGTWNVIDGILAIGDSKVFGPNTTFIFSNLNTWGWIVLLLGVLQLMAAFAVVQGSEIARWFGIAVAGVNAIGQMALVPVYPWWALAIFAVDVFIIYGLAVYGGKRLRA